jgi:5'-nucleotidase
VLRERTRIEADVPVCAQVDETLGTCEARVLRGAPRVALVPASFRGRAIVPNTHIEALLAPALAELAEHQRRPLGVELPSPLMRAYEAESPLGSAMADALREVTGADVALLNSGGLRADLPAGELTYGHVYEAIPFENSIAVVSVSAADLRRLLEAAYGARLGVFQVSGLKVSLDACPGAGRLEGLALPDGRPLPEGHRFRVAMPDFLARGGDGLGPVLDSLPPGSIDLGEGRELSFRDALVAHWQAQRHPLAPPPPGRIHLRAGRHTCAVGATAERH